MFPKFMSLPLELRQMIWIFAIPRRTLFYEAATHIGYDGAHGLRNLTLPVPMIAAASFITCDDDGGPWLQPDWTQGNLMAETRTDIFAASWTDTDAGGSDYLRCAPKGRVEQLARVWNNTLHPGGKQNTPKRIYVQFNPHDTTIPLYVRKAYGPLIPSCPDDVYPREEIRFTVELFDDAKLAALDYLNTVPRGKNFQDEKTPEERHSPQISYSFESCRDCKHCKVRAEDSEVCRLREMSPRYTGCFYWPNKGLCFNCLRMVWKEREESRMLGFWLRVQWVHEFSPSTVGGEEGLGAEAQPPDAKKDVIPIPEVFPNPRCPLQYKEDHPWVKEKLLQAPELRPIVTIRLSVHVEGREPPEPDPRSYPFTMPNEWAHTPRPSRW
ncbi:hypothetical protein V8F20_011517 [Naviculisporaceae sp. PSN 640]